MVDARQIAEKVRDLILGSIREEFKEFKAEVRGQLEGYSKAIEGMKMAMDSMNKRIDSVEKRLDSIDRSS